MNGDELIVAPCALNPIMARIAEDAGFKAVYMSGGSLGWLKCVTEANLALPELAEIAVDMRAVCKLPIILDGGGGWGDPMHVHRTIALTQAAGFAAIEIEDQWLPRRVEHHIGIDNLVTTELMVDKVKEAIAARSAIAWRRRRAPRSPQCTRRCANPWSALPMTSRTCSSAPAAPTRK
jgi:methylisocitrate lyase